MRLDSTRVGVAVGHSSQGATPVDAYHLSGGNLAVTVWTYGATLVEVRVPDGRGHRTNVVVRLPDLAGYEQLDGRAYLGATMGRYARCISGSQLTIDGTPVRLTPTHGAHHLHGGRFGFDAFVWDVVDTECSAERVAVRMRLRRPDGDEGYPGELVAETTYAVERGDRLVFEHVATTTRTTPCDITNHAMWNLAGDHAIDGHHLAINAERVLLVDADLIPCDAPVPVGDAALDFRASTSLVGCSLDNCFALDDRTWAARLLEPRSGRRMTIITDQPGLQVYTGDQFRQPRAGICLQAGSWPNAPLRADFPSAWLAPNQIYRSRTIHQFECV